MSDELKDFKHFMQKREAAARDYVCGDASALDAMATHDGDATFFGPMGGALHGARAVANRYVRDAGHFKPGSETHFEVLQLGASGGLGYWVGFQHALVRLAGRPEPVAMKLRVSEVFRREGTSWKLVHRHADGLSNEDKPGP